jgi:hypothetical protein
MENRGGKRDNAGRKATGVETKTIAFRVPVKHESEIKKLLKLTLSKFLKSKSV